MLTVQQAANHLAVMEGKPPRGFDDPTESGLTLRWWLCERGHIHRAWWRGYEHDLGPLVDYLDPATVKR